jgi:hypothetical protein
MGGFGEGAIFFVYTILHRCVYTVARLAARKLASSITKAARKQHHQPDN